MSIIYDALKKVEGNIKDSDNKTLKPKIDKGFKLKPKVWLLFILAVCLGFFAANFFYGLLNPSRKYLSKKDSAGLKQPIQPSQDISDTATGKNADNISAENQLQSDKGTTESGKPSETRKQIQPLLVLNGVFFSENQGYALINNRILKEGDTIDGVIVERISLDGVELKSDGAVIILSTGSQ